MNKIFWQQTIDGETVEFDNSPFVFSEIRKLDCQYGSHYYKQKQNSGRHLHLQGTRKIGCKAHIVIRKITVYSDFQLSEDEVNLGPRNYTLSRKKKDLNNVM